MRLRVVVHGSRRRVPQRLEANGLEVRAALRHLGDLPVTEMTTQLDPARATNGTWVGGPDWLKTQFALTNISRRSRIVVTDTMEHDIQFHRPDQIAAAVREILTIQLQPKK